MCSSIEEHLHCQCTSLAVQSVLLTRYRALREYPGDCLLAATYTPIRLPMCNDASPIFTVQHMLSKTAHQGRDCIIEEHMQYGIDELSTVFAQMPVFIIVKPSTNEHLMIQPIIC
ncbi:hypothetical protein GGH96_003583 [Coemansia sp. RSA 1972]|nr:hypothetical protein GGH96_003583 [Coemansia sp. RSA 1972]